MFIMEKVKEGGMNLKKLSWFIFILVAIFLLASCGSKTDEEGTSTVGIAMPTKSSERWVVDGDNMKKEFEALGYQVDMQYAEDVVENQISQIENMITKGVDILVIASIDGEALTEVLDQAENQNIPRSEEHTSELQSRGHIV